MTIYKIYISVMDTEKLEELKAEMKDEGMNFIKYFMVASKIEKLAILGLLGIVFAAGALIF
jgi:hypothetical protein